MKKFFVVGLLLVLVTILSGCSFQWPTKVANNINNIAGSADEDKLAIQKLFAADWKLPVERMVINIDQRDSNYIRGSVGALDISGEPSPGGGWFFAAKQNGKWKIVDAGNGTISCPQLRSYSFPTSMMTDCIERPAEPYTP